jgi:hypothetical protein
MTLLTGLRSQRYELHGIALTVHVDDGRVLAAVDLRLCDFAIESHSQAEIEISFLTGNPDERTAPPAGGGRPVYDTPYGPVNYFAATDSLCGELGGVRLRCEPSAGSAVLQCPCFEGRALYLATHPLTTICLMELLERRELFSLHAACVATGADRGVLFAGPSGAGKSTLALLLARAGFAFLGDDVVFLRRDRDRIRALGFADAIGLTHRLELLFGNSGEAPLDISGPEFPKRLQRIERLCDADVLGACIPRALIFPRVVDTSRSWIAPLHPGEALLRIVPDVLLTEPVATQEHLAAFGTLLEQVDCYEFGSGSDLDRGVELLRSVLDDAVALP